MAGAALLFGDAVITPAISVRKSLASADFILSLIDGKPYKTLKRHLAQHGLTPEQYRERYKLPKSYPMVAPAYSEARRAVGTVMTVCGREDLTTGEAVILYRTNAQSRPLEEELQRVGLPYTIVGGIRFYERKEVKDLVAYMRIVANPADDVSLLRVINVPKRGIGNTTIVRLRACPT